MPWPLPSRSTSEIKGRADMLCPLRQGRFWPFATLRAVWRYVGSWVKSRNG